MRRSHLDTSRLGEVEKEGSKLPKALYITPEGSRLGLACRLFVLDVRFMSAYQSHVLIMHIHDYIFVHSLRSSAFRLTSQGLLYILLRCPLRSGSCLGDRGLVTSRGLSDGSRWLEELRSCLSQFQRRSGIRGRDSWGVGGRIRSTGITSWWADIRVE